MNILCGEISRLTSTSEQSLSSTPPLAVTRLEQHLQKSIDLLNELYRSLKKGLKSLDPETFQGSTSGGQASARTISINFSESLIAIARTLDEAYSRFIQIRMTLPEPEGKPLFPGLVDSFRDLVEDSKAAQKSIISIKELAQEAEKTAREYADSAKGHAGLSESYTEESEKSRVTIKELLQKSGDNFKEIEKIVTLSNSLKEHITKHQSDFDILKKDLAEQKSEIHSGKEERDRLISELKNIEEEIKEKNSRSDEMLSGATIAGLASSFGAARDTLGTEMSRSVWAFYGSIFILAVTAIPMILYVLPDFGLFSRAQTPASQDPWSQIADIAARLAILLPGIWLSTFTARRYASLFRLREHYNYKYNMAYSVEGFKKQADPSVAPAIAATAFYELLTRNPADAMDGGKMSDDENIPNPLINAILKKLGIGRGKDSA
ncbi:MAG: hypothetical protein JJU06_16765 [Ectothiorhodospiraceae bacterium]|nr:hypothetical protein [Ectothiorhodospiraceae bacterium]